MKPLKDCIMCDGDGKYPEPRGEFWGVPCSEPVPCPCLDRKPEIPYSVWDRAFLISNGFDDGDCHCAEFAAHIISQKAEIDRLKTECSKKISDALTASYLELTKTMSKIREELK